MFEPILEGMIKAGWVLIPLMAASLIGWFIVFHRLIGLSRLDWGGLSEWRRRLASGNWESWLAGLPEKDRRTVAGNALAKVYQARAGGREAMEAHLDEVMKFRIPELEQSLSTLAILASAAPLMGLLGTVAGIVRTFQVISAFGTGNQALMSDSIAESLMATQNGLLVAFPLLLMHVCLSAKAESIEKNALAAARALINRCSVPGPRGPGERPGAPDPWPSGSYPGDPVPALGYPA
ncbi:MAG TPA: MotA/TolQ/ExbB proton channel family protein [Fibrobacteria bacterium]|nr:MotA/TolQ/ExbB proton channel family protein [Fibrobacteria bacterium]